MCAALATADSVTARIDVARRLDGSSDARPMAGTSEARKGGSITVTVSGSIAVAWPRVA